MLNVCWGTTLSTSVACQSVSAVLVTHTAGLRYRVGTVFSMSVLVPTSCLCNPHIDPNRGFPSPGPLQHICRPIFVCLSVFVLSLTLYLAWFTLWSTDCNQLSSASLHLPARHVALCGMRRSQMNWLPPGFAGAEVMSPLSHWQRVREDGGQGDGTLQWRAGGN